MPSGVSPSAADELHARHGDRRGRRQGLDRRRSAPSPPSCCRRASFSRPRWRVLVLPTILAGRDGLAQRAPAPALRRSRRGDRLASNTCRVTRPILSDSIVLRVGRAARRSAAARPAGDRRRRGRAGGQLRGQGAAACAPRWAGAQARRLCPQAIVVPAADGRPTRRRARRCSRSSTTRRRWSRGSRSTRRSSTCAGMRADRRHAARDRGAAAATVRERGRPADHGRRRAHEVPRQGGERRGQARRPAAWCRRTASWRSCTRCRSSGSGASGRSPREKLRARGIMTVGAGRAARRGGARRDARPGAGRQLHALAHNRDPRRVQRGAAPALDRARSARSAARRATLARARRRRSSALVDRAQRAGCARPGGVVPHGRAAAALRRLHARDALAHAAERDGARPRRSWPRRAGCWRRAMPMIERSAASRWSASRSRNLDDDGAVQLALPLDRARRAARRGARRRARPLRHRRRSRAPCCSAATRAVAIPLLPD